MTTMAFSGVQCHYIYKSVWFTQRLWTLGSMTPAYSTPLVLNPQHCHWYAATHSPSPKGSYLSWLQHANEGINWAISNVNTSAVIQLAEGWCNMVWNGRARNRTRDIWSEGESTIGYIITSRCAMFNNIDKLPELYFITAQRTWLFTHFCYIYRPRKDERLS